MTGGPLVIYLHGVGGVRPGWAEDLLGEITGQPVGDFRMRVVAPPYAQALEGPIPPSARRLQPRHAPATAETRAAYLQRQRKLAQLVAATEDVVPAGISWPAILPRPTRFPITGLLESPARFIAGLEQARGYLSDEARRASVADCLIETLSPIIDEQDGPIILIGHSLGAVVALDLLRQWDLDVALLITMGAPLGHQDVAERLLERDIDMQRLGAWLNVVHLLDPVPLGRGASGLFPAAVDAFLPVLSGGRGLRGLARGFARAATAHLDSTYLASEVVHRAVLATLTPNSSGLSS